MRVKVSSLRRFKSATRFRKRGKTFRKIRKLSSKIPRTMNALSKKLNGFSISRFLMRSFNISDANILHNVTAGLCTNLVFSGIPQYVDLNTDVTNIDALPGNIDLLAVQIFSPQWPGSHLTAFPNGVTGSATPQVGLQSFGLLPNCNALDGTTFNENFPFNDVCVRDTKVYGSTHLVSPTNPKPYNKLIVHNSYIKCSYTNTNTDYGCEVHVFHVIMEEAIGNPLGTGCIPITDVQAIMQQMYAASDIGIVHIQGEAIVRMIRKGKLPKKVFRVLKHTKLTLGPMTVLTVGPQPQRNTQQLTTRPCNAVYRAKFGAKTWYRTACSDAMEQYTPQPLTSDLKKTVQIMAIVLPMESAYFSTSLQTSDQYTNSFIVTQEIEKTNVWETRMN